MAAFQNRKSRYPVKQADQSQQTMTDAGDGIASELKPGKEKSHPQAA
jgi:hypothetical protein